MTKTVPRLVSRADFARQVGLSVRTLENWETRSYGPKPLRMGRTVRYSADEVECFIGKLGRTDMTRAAS